MESNCCYTVGSYPISGNLSSKCIISVNISHSTDVAKIGDCLIVGPTIGTISISGYAANFIHVACPGKAGVQIPWIRKYDCDENVVHFLFSGEGKSFVAGDVGNMASVNEVACVQTVINASVSSGPGSIYSHMSQTEGHGLSYVGDPISFDTRNQSSLMFNGNSVGSPYSECYMQSFSLDMNSGQIPTATYSYVFFVSN